MRRACWFLLLLVHFSGCRPEGWVRPGAFAPDERLLTADCSTGSDLLAHRLTLPRQAGRVVSARLTIRTETEQQAERDAFTLFCAQKLVGQARRNMLRCWIDSQDAESFLSCNDRF